MRILARYGLILTLVIVLHGLCRISGALPFFDFRCYDLLAGRPEAPFTPDSAITLVVEIDEESLQRLGQWPWPRLLLAKTVELLLQQRPAAVGLDIFFPEADRTSPVQIARFYRQLLDLQVPLESFPPALIDHDRIFAAALARGPTVLPLFLQHQPTAEARPLPDSARFGPLPPDSKVPQAGALLINTPMLQQAATGSGYINAALDRDGVFRRQPLVIGYDGQLVPGLALALLRQIDPAARLLPSAPESWAPLCFDVLGRTVHTNQRGETLTRLYPATAFRRVSLARLLSGEVPADLASGKIVLIGATAAGLFDQYITPAGEVLPGVFVHAALLENLLRGVSLYQPDSAPQLAFGLSLVLSLVLVWLVLQHRYLLSWITYLGGVCGTVLFAWLLLRQGVYVALGYFLLPFSFLFFLVSLFFAVLHYVERKRFLEDLGAAHSATIDSMTMVAESRDIETGCHIQRTKEYVRLLANQLLCQGLFSRQLSPHVIDLLFRAAPLHDIGKVGIPDEILRKPARLTDAETAIMRSHVTIGYRVIQNAINSYNKTNEFLSIAANIAYSHHEKWDGSGYPQGLRGEQIPLEARLMALADVYDALTSRRCYKDIFPFEEAEELILAERDRHFDPRIVDAFALLRPAFREVACRYRASEQEQRLAARAQLA
ncbi:MAG: CHASE2 domain-containing protein [Desulfuromonas thiophila]|nr:CHASE2 domain-containing protein [Desulfuromonas thiophila]